MGALINLIFGVLIELSVGVVMELIVDVLSGLSVGVLHIQAVDSHCYNRRRAVTLMGLLKLKILCGVG